MLTSQSPFVARALNRSYECMISLLWKYPWFSTDLVTIGERGLLFRTTVGLLRVLFRCISTNSNPAQLSQLLLQELLCAALNVPFSHVQKLEIASTAASAGFAPLVQSTGFTPMANIGAWWPFEALDKKAGVSDAIVGYYAQLLHEAYPNHLSPFGNLPVNYPAEDVRVLPLRIAAAAEWEAMSVALSNVLQYQLAPGRGFDAAPGAHLRPSVNALPWRPAAAASFETPTRAPEAPANTPSSDSKTFAAMAGSK